MAPAPLAVSAFLARNSRSSIGRPRLGLECLECPRSAAVLLAAWTRRTIGPLYPAFATLMVRRFVRVQDPFISWGAVFRHATIRCHLVLGFRENRGLPAGAAVRQTLARSARGGIVPIRVVGGHDLASHHNHPPTAMSSFCQFWDGPTPHQRLGRTRLFLAAGPGTLLRRRRK